MRSRSETVWRLFAGGVGRGERAADGDRRIRRHDVPQDDRGVRPRAELLEAVRRHELPASRGRRRRRQDAAARGAPLVTPSSGARGERSRGRRRRGEGRRHGPGVLRREALFALSASTRPEVLRLLRWAQSALVLAY